MTKPRKPPMLMRSDLTGHVYIVTSYSEPKGRTGLSPDTFVANTKYDVTDQFRALMAKVLAEEAKEEKRP